MGVCGRRCEERPWGVRAHIACARASLFSTVPPHTPTTTTSSLSLHPRPARKNRVCVSCVLLCVPRRLCVLRRARACTTGRKGALSHAYVYIDMYARM